LEKKMKTALIIAPIIALSLLSGCASNRKPAVVVVDQTSQASAQGRFQQRIKADVFMTSGEKPDLTPAAIETLKKIHALALSRDEWLIIVVPHERYGSHPINGHIWIFWPRELGFSDKLQIVSGETGGDVVVMTSPSSDVPKIGGAGGGGF
jgi:hypothetical protein